MNYCFNIIILYILLLLNYNIQHRSVFLVICIIFLWQPMRIYIRIYEKGEEEALYIVYGDVIFHLFDDVLTSNITTIVTDYCNQKSWNMYINMNSNSCLYTFRRLKSNVMCVVDD